MMTAFYAQLKREWLEHTNLWRVPLILIGLAVLVRLSMVFGNLSVDVNLPEQLQLDDAIGSVLDGAIARVLNVMNSIIVFSMIIVACVYALSCLFAERQDQSVLFWRSLPISDTQTVLSKLFVALVGVPVIIVLCQIIVTVIFLDTASGQYLSHYFSHSLGHLGKLLLWALLPTIAWCLFCSSIANRSPFIIALFAPLAVIVVDWLFLDGALNELAGFNRLIGFDDFSLQMLLVGFVLSAVFIALAINRRRQRI